jgi:hypothetical protein
VCAGWGRARARGSPGGNPRWGDGTNL